METEIPIWDMVVRLVAAVVLAGLIGLEREIRGRPAGLRTHMLVSLGAAGFLLVGYEIMFSTAVGDPSARIDPLGSSRVSSGVSGFWVLAALFAAVPRSTGSPPVRRSGSPAPSVSPARRATIRRVPAGSRPEIDIMRSLQARLLISASIRRRPQRAALITLLLGGAAGYSRTVSVVAQDLYEKYVETESERRASRRR